MIHNINAYSRSENNCGDDSIMFLPDDKHLCDTLISENTDLIRNQIYKRIYSVLSSLHIGGENTGYNQAKQKLPEILPFKNYWTIESNTILDFTGDEGEIHLLVNLKYTVIVSDRGSSIINMPHSMILVFCETIIRDYQNKTEADTGHCF